MKIIILLLVLFSGLQTSLQELPLNESGQILLTAQTTKVSNNSRSTTELEISIQSNPMLNTLKVNLDSEQSETAIFTLYNLVGKKEFQYTATLNQGQVEWEVINLPVGIYLLSVSNEAGTIQKTFKLKKIGGA